MPPFVLNAQRFDNEDFLVAQTVESLPATQETWVRSRLGSYPEKEMTTCSSILAWKILWTEEPGRLQSMESQELDTT